MADEIDLSGINLATEAAGAANLIVIARQINMNNAGAIHLTGRHDGGALVLVAFDGFRGGGALSVSAAGQDGAKRAGECRPATRPAGTDFNTKISADNGGNGGDVIIYSGSGSGSGPLITVQNNGGAAGEGCSWTYHLTQTMDEKCTPELTIMVPKLEGGRLVQVPVVVVRRQCEPLSKSSVVENLDTLRDGRRGNDGQYLRLASLSDVVRLLSEDWTSQWSHGMLLAVTRAAEDAIRRKDTADLVKVFRRYGSLPSLPVTPDELEKQTDLVRNLNDLRRRELPPLWWRTIAVEQSGLPSASLMVLTDSVTLENRIPPTTALLRTERIEEKGYLGFVQSDVSRPGLVKFHFSARLTTDPYVENLLKTKLAAQGERYSGQFAGWKLVAHMEALAGVSKDDTNVAVTGNVLEATVAVDEVGANLFLWKLGSSPGLRFTVDWQYATEDRAPQTGPAFEVYVSARRREDATVRAAGLKLRNTGNAAAAVAYIVGAGGQVQSFGGSPLQLRPGQEVDCPCGSETTTVDVPPTAVELTSVNPFSLTEFYIAADQSIFHKIRVANLLPPYDEKRGGALRFVEIYLEYWEKGKPTDKHKIGPFRLVSAAQDGELRFDFIKSPASQVVVRVSGTAYYDNGSHSEVKPFDTEDLAITITPDRLVE
ncbi:MAG TPA: hypothetical protein VGQ21_18670 [Thermoanaerobaculia bacterium]|nr:hypothetical protein [Thermoanaerobaculia bacterium]